MSVPMNVPGCRSNDAADRHRPDPVGARRGGRLPQCMGAFLALATAASCGVAAAAPGPALDRVGIWLGEYLPTVDASISARLNPVDIGRGHAALRSRDETVPRTRLEVLVGDRHGLAFDYTRFARDRELVLEDAFSYQGHDFEAGDRIEGHLRFEIGNAAYRWWFGDGRDVFGVGIGAAWYRLDVGLSGHPADAPEDEIVSLRFADSAVAPLITLGWRHAFSDRLRIYADGSGIWKKGNRLSGHLYNASVGIEWFAWRHVGIGAEYGMSRARVRRERDLYDAGLDLDLRGPSLFLRARL